MAMTPERQHYKLATTGKAFKKGGKVESDEAQDRKLVKQMVKPEAMKKAGGKVKEKQNGKK